MLDKLGSLMEKESKETIKGVFLILKGQINAQLAESKKALLDILEFDKLSEEDQAAFNELSDNMDATGASLAKVIDVILKKVDED